MGAAEREIPLRQHTARVQGAQRLAERQRVVPGIPEGFLEIGPGALDNFSNERVAVGMGPAGTHSQHAMAGLYAAAVEHLGTLNRAHRETGEIDTFAGGPGGAVRPVPSPDGKTVAFVKRLPGMNSALYLKDVESGKEWAVYDRLVVELEKAGTVVAASGRDFVYAVAPNKAAIYSEYVPGYAGSCAEQNSALRCTGLR